MGTYISSKGEQRDTSVMPTAYINSALQKAREFGNQENIDALEAELSTREQVDQNATNEQNNGII